MHRLSWAVWGCLVLAGCQSVPVAKAPVPPKPTTPLFGEEVELDHGALREAVLRRIPVGTTMAEAKNQLQGEGFTICPSKSFDFDSMSAFGLFLRSEDYPVVRQKDRERTYCRKTIRLCEWGIDTRELVVILLFDNHLKHKAVLDLAAAHGLAKHPYGDFFKDRPQLREPLGLPVEEARQHMEAHGFRCEMVKEGRPHLLCTAYDEKAIHGNIVRVNLYTDEAGLVRDSAIERDRLWFEAERCLLPRQEDSLGWAACKTVLYPVRLGSRYALFCAALTLAYGVPIRNN